MLEGILLENNKKLGKALSLKIYKIFTSQNPDELVNSNEWEKLKYYIY